MRDENKLTIGQIVKVIKGRERDTYAIVINHVSDRFIEIADGKYRRFEKPKRKNIQHVESTDFIAEEISHSIAKTGRISNAKIRYVLEEFLKNNLTEEQMKGEIVFGERGFN